MFTPISEILDKIDALCGRSVSLTGELLVGEGDQPFLATDYEQYKRGKALLVLDNRAITDHLLQTLPVYGGGDVIYAERAFLSGTVVAKAGGHALAQLSYCKIVRDDFEIVVPLMGT